MDTLRSVGLTEQADALAAQLNRLDPANPENMVSQLGRLRDGTAQLRYNLTSPDAPYLSGVNQHGDGPSQLADGSTELRAGTERLQDGTVRLKDGSSERKSKLDEGVAKAPKVSQLDRSAHQVAVPILFDEANLHPTQEVIDPANPTVKSVESGFSIIIMLVFGYLVMAVLSALLPHLVGRHQDSRTGVGPVLKAFGLIFGINALVMAVLTAISVALGWRPDHWLVMLAVLALIAANGAALFQFFRILFGRLVGGLVSIGFFALGLFVFGRVRPLPTIRGPLQLVYNLHPMSYARYGFIRATDGLYDARFWGSLAALLAFTAAAVVASTVIYNARCSEAATELAEDRVGEQPLSPIVRLGQRTAWRGESRNTP